MSNFVDPQAYQALMPVYRERFGHGVPRKNLRAASLSDSSALDLTNQLAEALRSNTPIPGWEEQYAAEQDRNYPWSV